MNADERRSVQVNIGLDRRSSAVDTGTRLLSDWLPSSLKDGRERATFLLLASCVATVLVSIAISQILLAAAVVAVLWPSRSGRPILAWPSYGWPLLLFFTWTLLTALASADPLRDLTIVKKFFILLLLVLVPLIAQGGSRVLWIYHAVFLLAAVSASLGLGQFIWNPQRDMLHRISGFMSQWMTYSGLQMLVIVALCAYAVTFGWRRWWVLPLALLLCLSLFLTYTRNAWLGTLSGTALVLLLCRPKAIAGLAVVIMFLYLVAPAGIKQRLHAGFDPQDTTTRGRIELAQTSIRLIRDNLWFGAGPKSVRTEALRYRGTHDFPDWLYQHMHNNFLQLAAERGIPGLLFWLWFMARLAWDPLLMFRALTRANSAIGVSSGQQPAVLACVAALGSWVALMVAGMFEYNFGDSEVLTLFLFLMSAPYAAWPRSGDRAESSGH
jgi:O-antigen ligase